VENIQLKIGDPEAALATAREEAVAKATAKAEEYADATGQKLGDVLTLREVDDQAQSSIDGRNLLSESAYAADSALARMPVSAGRADLGVAVQVVWEFA
ncbi:MAG: SIMPL domain-containing protein, partial [Actinomycetota bacterium]|nr:SIMPL domain-containing protein [Actinomycetota bacterium]